jgi:hypothetical protein
VLAPMEHISLPSSTSDGQRIEVRDSTRKHVLCLLSAPVGGAGLTVLPGDLRGQPDAALGVDLTFRNDGEEYADLFWVADRDGVRVEEAWNPDQPVRPGSFGPPSSTFAGTLWIARSRFSGEVLGMHVAVGESDVFSFTSSFPGRFRSSLVPSPLPGNRPVSLIESSWAEPDPRDSRYLVVSEFDAGVAERFNTVPDVAVRGLQITGVELVWAAGENRQRLLRYGGPGGVRHDIARLDIFADRVVINEPLAFPGTDVTIFARVLEIGARGSIDTTPRALPPTAVLSERDPTTGKPRDYTKVTPGLDGQHGGNLTLNVGELVVADPTKPVFRARGADGQAGEPGGVKAYAPTAASPTKDVSARVNTDAIRRYFDAAYILPDWKNLDGWRWPATPGSAEECSGPDEFVIAGRHPLHAYAEPDAGAVVDMWILAVDDHNIPDGDVRAMYLPTGPTELVAAKQNGGWYHRGHGPVFEGSGPEFLDVFQPAYTAPRPGNGEDAYAGGRPGRGGDGGTVRSTVPLPPEVADCSGGSSPMTPGVQGGRRGGPYPAYRVGMRVVCKEWGWQSRIPVQASLENVSATSDGAPAPAIPGTPGDDGQLVVEPGSWVSVEALDAVLTCAQDSFRAGHRAQARRLLDPYYAVLDALPASAELASRASLVRGVRDRLLANADFYGQPPGWIPRLGLLSTLGVFNALRENSIELLYYAARMQDRYDSLQHADEAAQQTAATLGRNLELRVDALREAYTAIALADAALDEVRTAVEAKEHQLTSLRTWCEETAEEAAKTRVIAQRLFRGIMKSIGGAMALVPAAQPVLGMVGGAVSTVGDFNWNDPDGLAKQITKTSKTLGERVDSAIAKNKDLLIADKAGALRKKFDLDGTQKKVSSLKQDVDKTKTAIADQTDILEQLRADTIKAFVAKEKPDATKARAALAKVEAELSAGADNSLATQVAALKANLGEDKAAELLERRRLLSDMVTALEAQIEKADEEERAARAAHEAEAEKLAAQRKKQIAELQLDLTKEKKGLDRLETAVKTAEQKSSEVTATVAEKTKAYENTLERFKGIGTGLAEIGDGIGSLVSLASLDGDDPEVKELSAKLYASKYGPDVTKLTEEFQQLGNRQRAALDRLQHALREADAHTAALAEGISALDALARRRQDLGTSTDVDTRRYLVSLRQRAVDSLRWSIYGVVMAWRYEYLEDVPGELFNLDALQRKLLTLAATKDGGPVANTTDLPLGEFKEHCQRVLGGELAVMARRLLERRQGEATSVYQNSVRVELSPAARRELALTGRTVINLIEMRTVGLGYNADNLRIAAITDLAINADVRGEKSMHVVIEHSGVSIVRNNGRYFYFQKAATDKPISWGFTYARGAIKPDKVNDRQDEVIKQLLATTLGKDAPLDFQEYQPSMFSDLTIRLNPTTESWDADSVAGIDSFTFTVDYTYTRP